MQWAGRTWRQTARRSKNLELPFLHAISTALAPTRHSGPRQSPPVPMPPRRQSCVTARGDGGLAPDNDHWHHRRGATGFDQVCHQAACEAIQERTFSIAGHRRLCAHLGRSRAPGRRSKADVRRNVAVATEMSAAGGFLPARFQDRVCSDWTFSFIARRGRKRIVSFQRGR